MKRMFVTMTMLLGLSAIAGVTSASWYGTIRSNVDDSLCMAVNGTVSEGANVQLYECNDPAPAIHRNWYVLDLDSSVCQWAAGTYYCIDYRAGDVDAIVTAKEPWKGNQRWSYSGDQRFRGNDDQCLDVNALDVGGPGQIKISACEQWKQYQQWKP